MKITNPFAVPEGTSCPREVFGYRPYLMSLGASMVCLFSSDRDRFDPSP